MNKDVDAIQIFLSEKQLRISELEELLIPQLEAQLAANPIYQKLEEYKKERDQVAAEMHDKTLEMLNEANIKTSDGIWGKATRVVRPSVVVENETAIPSTYFVMKRELDKAKVINDIQVLGKKIPGASVKESVSLRLTRRISESS